MRTEKTDFFEADDRTAWLWRNKTRTQKKMFMTAHECSKWVAEQNAALRPVESKRRK